MSDNEKMECQCVSLSNALDSLCEAYKKIGDAIHVSGLSIRTDQVAITPDIIIEVKDVRNIDRIPGIAKYMPDGDIHKVFQGALFIFYGSDRFTIWRPPTDIIPD